MSVRHGPPLALDSVDSILRWSAHSLTVSRGGGTKIERNRSARAARHFRFALSAVLSRFCVVVVVIFVVDVELVAFTGVSE